MVDRLLGYVTLSGTWHRDRHSGQVKVEPVWRCRCGMTPSPCRPSSASASTVALHLPAYMVPSHHPARVNTFPLSLNGKVQRSGTAGSLRRPKWRGQAWGPHGLHRDLHRDRAAGVSTCGGSVLQGWPLTAQLS